MFEQGLLTGTSQNLLVVFVALTTLAVLIQVGIVTGLMMAVMKMNKQADRAIAETRKLFGPLNRLVETMETASTRLAEFSASSQAYLRKAEARWEDGLREFRRKIA